MLSCYTKHSPQVSLHIICSLGANPIAEIVKDNQMEVARGYLKIMQEIEHACSQVTQTYMALHDMHPAGTAFRIYILNHHGQAQNHR